MSGPGQRRASRRVVSPKTSRPAHVPTPSNSTRPAASVCRIITRASSVSSTRWCIAVRNGACSSPPAHALGFEVQPAVGTRHAPPHPVVVDGEAALARAVVGGPAVQTSAVAKSHDRPAERAAQPRDDGDRCHERRVRLATDDADADGIDVVRREPDVSRGKGLTPVLLDVAAAAAEVDFSALDLQGAAEVVPERDDTVEALHERHEPVPAHDPRLAQRHRPRLQSSGVRDPSPQLRQIERRPVGVEDVAADAHLETPVGCRELLGVEAVIPRPPRDTVEHLDERLVGRHVATPVATEHSRDHRPPVRAVGRDELDVPALEERPSGAAAVEGLGMPRPAQIRHRSPHAAHPTPRAERTAGLSRRRCRRGCRRGRWHPTRARRR